MTTDTVSHRRALAAVSAVVTAGVLPAFLTGALSVQIRADLGFEEAGLGMAVAGFFVGATAASAALGRAAERLGPAVSMRISAAFSAGSMLLVAAAARSLTGLVATLAVGGLANALAQPAANLYIARNLDTQRLGMAFAIKQAAVPTATLLGGLAVPALALTVGWRWAFVAGAGIALAGAVGVRTGATPPAVERDAAGSGRSTRGALLLLAVGVGLGAAAASTLGTFLVDAAVVSGIGEGPAGLLVAGGSALVITVRLLAGRRADRREGGHLRVAAGMLALGSAGYALYATGEAWVLVAASAVTFAAGWGWPGLFNLAVVRANPAAPGVATGITQTGTYAGVVVGPLLFGVLVESRSYAVAWWAAAALSLLAAAAVYGGRILIRRQRIRAHMPVGL